MKPLPRRWAKWAVPGIVFTVIVAAAPTGGETSMANTADQPVDHAVKAAASSPGEEQQRAEVTRVELERLATVQGPGDATGAEQDAEIGNAFRATSWYVPPPPPPPQPPAPPPPPPAPSAPPLPFTYLGKYEDAPTSLVILVNGERMYAVAEGDVIDGIYRVDRVTPGQVELTYLPLDIKQILNTGEAL